MPRLDPILWQERLETSLAGCDVPGAALAIAIGDERLEVAAGTLNLATSVTATPDSLFQIGSVSKPFTALLLMQLAEKGRLSLDHTLEHYFPQLVARHHPWRFISVRHLLSHTSGLEGDYFVDTGRGDDALASYATRLASLPPLSAPGVVMSYCNAGFSLAARIVEIVTGQVWDEALRERLCRPAGLTRTLTLPEDALRHRVAWGHVTTRDGAVRLTPIWAPPRAVGPAGLISATAGDVLTFASLCLNGGANDAGASLLSERSIRTMLEPAVDTPEPWTMGSQWSLGWALSQWDGRHLFGHTGDGNGYSAYLHVLPDARLIFVLLTNHIQSRPLYEPLVTTAFAQLADLRVPRLPPPPAPTRLAEPNRYVGTYLTKGCRLEITHDDQGLCLHSSTLGGFARWFGDQRTNVRLAPLDRPKEQFVTLPAPRTPGAVAAFVTGRDGRRYLSYGMRASPRLASL